MYNKKKMLLVEGVLHPTERVDPIECEGVLSCDSTLTPLAFNELAQNHNAVMFCGHGPAPDDPSGLALYRRADGRLMYLRPSDIQTACWKDKVFVSTA